MDDRQLTAMIERVLRRVQEEMAGASGLPKAYVILPRDWRGESQGRCVETLRALSGAYQVIAVLPDGDSGTEALCQPGVIAAVRQSEAVFPCGDFPTIFPTPDRNRVVKTALCLQDDFETGWIGACIARGQPIYMPGESPLFTGKEPEAYKKKIEAYYRDAAAFGIQFDRLPAVRGEGRKPALTGPAQKKKVITAKDLEQLETSKELRLRPGDVVTALAAERAEELGIRILYQ